MSVIGKACELAGPAGDFLRGLVPTNNKTNDDGLTEEQRKIVEQKKIVAITQSQGIIFDTAERIHALGPHVTLASLPAYLTINADLTPLIDGKKDKTGKATAGDKDLEQNARIRAIFTAIAALRDETNDPIRFDEYLNAAEEQIIYIKAALQLNPENKYFHYNHISLKIDLLKEYLENAAIELGKQISVWGEDDDVVKDCIKDFNDLFKRGYELNQAFERKKRANPSLLDLQSWENMAKSGGKTTLDLWSNPILGRGLSLAVSYSLTHGLPLVYSLLNLPTGSLDLSLSAMFLSQPAITLYVDEALRLIKWRKEKKSDIFNFTSGRNNGLKFGSSSASTLRTQLDKEARTRTFTHEVDEKKQALQRKSEEIAKLTKLRANLDICIKALSEEDYENLTFDSIDDFVKAINDAFESYIFEGYQKKDTAGAVVIKYLNDGELYTAIDLKNLDTVRRLYNIVTRKLIPEITQEKTVLEGSIRREAFFMEKEGIVAGASSSKSEISRRSKATHQSDVKTKFVDYTTANKQKFFRKLSDATIRNNRFENLDTETKIFLTQLCDHYATNSKKGFKNAIELEFSLATNTKPNEQLMNAIEYEAAGYRRN